MTELEIARNIRLEVLYRAAHSATMALFAALPLGVQVQFDSVLKAADASAKHKDFARAAEIVGTCAVPDALLNAQQQLVAALQHFGAKADAVRAAQTVAQVNAIAP